MSVTGDRLRTMADQIDSGQLDKDATAAQLRALAHDTDSADRTTGDVQQQNQARANAAGGAQPANQVGGAQTTNEATGQPGPRGSW